MDPDRRIPDGAALTCARCAGSIVFTSHVERPDGGDLGVTDCGGHPAYAAHPGRDTAPSYIPRGYDLDAVVPNYPLVDEVDRDDPEREDDQPDVPEAAELIERNLAIRADARARALPGAVGVATGVVGCATWGGAWLAGQWIGPDAHDAVVTGTVVGTALSVPMMRLLFRQSIPEAWRRRWWLAGLFGAGWVDLTVTMTDPASLAPMLCVLGLGSAALAWGWIAEHEAPNPADVPEAPLALPAPEPMLQLPPPPPPPPLPVPYERTRADELEELFYARVADGRNPSAPGAMLPSRRDLPHGTQWRVLLDPEGSIGATEFVELELPIARALQIRATHVILEHSEDEEDGEDVAVMTLVTRDVLKGGVAYRGPHYDGGLIRIGLFADGSGPAMWTAYSRTDGPRFGLVIGGSGSGKSAALAILGMGYRHSGEWLILFGDGDKDGASSPLLRRTAHHYAKGADVLRQLEAVEAWMRMRGKLMHTLTAGPDGKPIPLTDPATQEPVSTILPCPNYQGLAWVLDELHDLLEIPELQAAGFARRLSDVARTMRKRGGKIIVGTQSVGDFRADSTFRSVLAAGNLLMMRSGDRTERYAVSDGASPTTLPRGSGYAFLEDSGRRAMLRTEHDEDMSQWLLGLPAAPTDHRSMKVIERYCAPRVVDASRDHQEALEEVAAFDAALETGAPLPGETAPDEPGAAVEPDGEITVGGVSIPQIGQLAPRPTPAAPTGEATVTPIQPPARPRKVTPLSEYGGAALADSQATVLALLRANPGPRKSGWIAEKAKLTPSTTSKALKALVAQGLIREVVYAIYEAIPQDEDAG